MAGHTIAELERIREADAKIKAKERLEFEPEKNVAKPVAFFEVDRYTQGQFMGLFVVYQVVLEDKFGRLLKTPKRNVICEGVDLVVGMSAIETALRRRVYR